jgi:LmbE family N-acetylglucosaminyl deacetylase
MEMKSRLKPLSEEWEKALAVVAHPDDLEFGASSAIARWTGQGKEVNYLLITRGEAGMDAIAPEKAASIREREEQNSARVVGVKTVEFLDYRDGVIEYGLPLRRDIARAIRKHCPNVLITLNHRLTFGGTMLNMADHRWVGLAVLDAARDAGNRWIFPELIEEGLKPWNGVKRVLISGSPQPTHAVDISSFLEKGIASLKEHRAYLKNLSDFDPESFLRENASSVGKLLGCRYAESFEVIEI